MIFASDSALLWVHFTQFGRDGAWRGDARRAWGGMDALTLFGLFAVTFMLVCYMKEAGSHWWTLAFAAGCLMGSAYGFLQGAWPFGLVELAWTAVAFNKWLKLRKADLQHRI